MATRTSNKALANLSALKALEGGAAAPETAALPDYAAQAAASQKKVKTQPVAEITLAGQEAIVDRKISQTGQNAVTGSRAWDILGNVLGFKTQTDWEDEKANIDAQQAAIAEQDRMAAEAIAVAEAKAISERNAFADQDVQNFTDQALNVNAATEEDRSMIANFILDREVATDMIRSGNPEIQKKGFERLTANDLAWKAYQQKNEEQSIQGRQWGAEQKVREGQLAETRRNNMATLAETRRSHLENENLAREQARATREIGTQTQFYEQHGKVHDVVQGAINDVYASIEEAARTNNPAALVNAQKKIAKLTDPTTGVLQGEMRDMVASGLGDRLVRAYNRGRGNVNQEDLNDLLAATKAIENSERQMYERNLEIARNRAKMNGVDPSTLDGHAYKPLESYGTASEAVKNKPTDFKPGDVISGGAEVVLEGAKAVGGVVGTVFGN